MGRGVESRESVQYGGCQVKRKERGNGMGKWRQGNMGALCRFLQIPHCTTGPVGARDRTEWKIEDGKKVKFGWLLDSKGRDRSYEDFQGSKIENNGGEGNLPCKSLQVPSCNYLNDF